jgi:hypothetical protein
MTHLALQASADFEIESEPAAGGLQQGRDFRAILSVLLVIGNE